MGSLYLLWVLPIKSSLFMHFFIFHLLLRNYNDRIIGANGRLPQWSNSSDFLTGI